MEKGSELRVYCPEHSEVMRSLGAIEEGNKSMAKDIGEIKTILQSQGKDIASDRIAQAKLDTRGKILYGLLLTAFVAVISEGVRYFMKFIGH